MIDYELTRSAKRKTIALSVRQGRVIVKAPWYATANFIEGFITSKLAWIEHKLALQKEHQSKRLYLFEPDSNVLYFGDIYRLVINTEIQSSSQFNQSTSTLILTTNSRVKQSHADEYDGLKAKIKQQINNIYKEKANDYLVSRFDEIVQNTDFTPSSLKIRKYTARWGSCDNKGRISLNSWLMACPKWVIDYVIIHELCHLVHFDHSPKFWQLVEKYCPDFKLAKQWLHSYNYILKN